MDTCKLVDELNRLRKSSSDSIDNEKTFDDFKQYMHIKRNVETDLKSILREVNASGKKTLVLLCGSAGDGKSHMLSYLKNIDSEHLLASFRIHNDATESSAPQKTAIQTLNEVLSDFSDEHINEPGQNLILAINLGVLNNFIESTYGQNYLRLKEYVEENDILSSTINDNIFDPDSSFQHISFADYQLYTLTEKGARSKYIESILERIFCKQEGNPFVNAFEIGCSNCPLKMECPVRYNFLFLQKENVRQYITNLMIMTIVKDKEIATTREILNYFYDITVPQDFSFQSLSQRLLNKEDALKHFIKDMTPNLIFDQPGVTRLMDHVKANDPLLYRDEESDDTAIEYYVSVDSTAAIQESLKNDQYKDVLLRKEFRDIENQDRNVKGALFNCITRINDMESDRIRDSVYEEFVKTLFYYNTGNIKKLGTLYESVKKAVRQWCGTDGEGHICLSSGDNKYSLFEEIDFDENLSNIPSQVKSEELERFMSEIRLGFNDQKNVNQVINLDVDYALYRLIKQLNSGYVHTANDRNDHADFISFTERIIKTGNASQEVIIISDAGKRSALERTKFGYKFEVVR